MISNKISIFIAALSLSIYAVAQDYSYPSKHEELSESMVYSIVQDCDGAIWLNSNSGLFRYNGNNLENLHYPFPYHSLASDENGRYIFACSRNAIYRYNIEDIEPTRIPTDGIPANESVFCADGESLVLGYRDSLYLAVSDSLRPLFRFPEGKRIASVLKLRNGEFAFGMEDGSILCGSLDSQPVLKTRAVHRISTMYQAPDGTIWIGMEAGCMKFNEDWSEGSLVEGINRLKTVRTICATRNGDVLFGTPMGMYRLSKEGKAEEVELSGSLNIPVFDIFSDREGDIWVGTLNHGVLYNAEASLPFHNESTPESLRMVSGLTKDRLGRFWAVTDACGMYVKSKGQWRLVSGTSSYKFQFARYDAKRDIIWSSDYMGGLFCVNPSDGTVSVIQEGGLKQSFSCMAILGDTLYLGTSNGLCSFKPERGKSGFKVIPGVSTKIRCMDSDRSGHLWIGTDSGIYRHFPETGETNKYSFSDNTDNAYWSDITRLQDGTMAAAILGRGVALIHEDGSTDYFEYKDGKGPGSPLSVNNFKDWIVVGCRNGISMIRPYSNLKVDFRGKTVPRISRGCYLETEEGMLLGSTHGVTLLDMDESGPEYHDTGLSFDHIYANGKEIKLEKRLPYAGKVRLEKGTRMFSVDVATFDYTGITDYDYEYYLEGFSKEWTKFDPSKTIDMMNIPPGHYVLKAKNADNHQREISLPLRIVPRWYEALVSRILFILLIIGTAVLFINMYIRHTILSNELESEKEQSREKTRFFVDLSNQIRTPLNLMIGQIEKYFRIYGQRSPGIEDIEDVYAKADNIRKMVTDYVNSQSDMSFPIETPEGRKKAGDAKFLNAAIEVVERNMFTQDITTAFLCSELNVGRTTLAERLTEITGMTPHAFVEDIRLRHAAQMILEGNKRISEIASDLRYSSPRYFSTRFKMKYGCLPSDYNG